MTSPATGMTSRPEAEKEEVAAGRNKQTRSSTGHLGGGGKCGENMTFPPLSIKTSPWRRVRGMSETCNTTACFEITMDS